MKNPDSSQNRHDSAWDDLFRQRLADHTDQPPADALNRILAGAGQPRPQAHQQWVPVSLAILLLLGAAGWLFLRQYKSVTEPLAGVVHLSKPVIKATKPAAQTADDRSVSIIRRPPVTNTPLRWLAADMQRPLATGNTERVYVNPLSTPEYRVANTQVANRNRTAKISDRRTLAIVASTVGSSSAQRGEIAKRNAPDEWRQPLFTGNRTKRTGGRYQPQSAGLEYGAANALAAPFADSPALVAVQLPGLMPTIDFLAGRPFQAFTPMAALPAVSAFGSVTEPLASQPRLRPSWFVSLTPLYTYQAINPIHTDAELVSDIRVSRSLATDRLGARLQLGTEWRLAGRLSVRTSLVYQQVRQSLRYAVRSTRPDSVQVVVLDNQSVQATPFFARQSYAETAVWHYAGLSTDMVWQLNRRVDNRWQHYVTLGVTAGRYVSRGGRMNGFVQAAYGVERPLTTRVYLRIEPTVQLGWQLITDQANRFQSRPYGYGAAFSLRFR